MLLNTTAQSLEIVNANNSSVRTHIKDGRQTAWLGDRAEVEIYVLPNTLLYLFNFVVGEYKKITT